jgi:hypothetical protein
MTSQQFLLKPKRPNGKMTNIHLRVPAQAEFVGLVRSTTNSVVARTELGIDELADWSLAMDEAFAIVINHKPTSGDVLIDYSFVGGGIEIKVAGPVGSSESVLQSDACRWAWAVVTGSVSEAKSDISSDGSITLILKSRVVASA